MKIDTSSSSQRALRGRMLAESCLDRRFPLALSPPFHVERGPTSEAFYKAKHARGEYGTYWPLHQTGRGH